jgi:hypothetical protein
MPPSKKSIKTDNRYCSGHIQLCEDIAVIKNTVMNLDKRINGSMDTIAKHIEESNKFRGMIIKNDERIKSIKGTKALVVTVLVTVLLSYPAIIFWGGKYIRQVEVNSGKLNTIDNLYKLK